MLVFALAAVGSIAWWWTHPPDPVAAIQEHWAPLASVERAGAPDLGPRYERWLLLDARGDSTHAVWRRAPDDATWPGRSGTAPDGATQPWTVVLLGGLRTGNRSVLLIPEDVPIHVLAVDWPWEGDREARLTAVALRAPAIRRAILRSPAVLALGVEAASRAPEVDPERIVLIGASLGVPPALASLRLARAPGALVLLYGSADLKGMMEQGLKRLARPRWLAALIASPVAALCARLVHPLEPALHAEAAVGVPTLMLGAEEDKYLPRQGVEELRHALPHATWMEVPGSHLLPHDREGAAELAGRVARWLDSGQRSDSKRRVGALPGR